MSRADSTWRDKSWRRLPCYQRSLTTRQKKHDKTNWNERRETSAGFRRVSYHACPHVSLTTSDVFVTCDTTQRTGLNLSANVSGCSIWARTQILNGPIRVEDETTLRAAVVVDPMPITSLWGKLKRRILGQMFCSLRVFPQRRRARIWSEIYWALWNCWFYCDSGLFFLRRKRFVEWRLASDGWSGFPANRGLSRRGKNERFAVARRETRRPIASFKETKYDSL